MQNKLIQFALSAKINCIFLHIFQQKCAIEDAHGVIVCSMVCVSGGVVAVV